MSKFTPEQLQMLVDLLPTARSLRDICAMMSLRLDDVRREAAPFLTIMRLSGTHPVCECGKLRFHPYGCAGSYAPLKDPDAVRGHSPDRWAELLDRRRKIVARIVAGDRYVDIQRDFGMSPHSARAYLRFLTDEQREQRRQAEQRRRPESLAA